MKTKIIIFLALTAIFIPSISYSAPVPFFDIAIIKNSSGADGIFSFDVSGPFNSEYLEIETENGEGISFASMMVNPGDDVRISENQQPGWQYGGVNCFSDDARVTTQITSNGVIIEAYPFSSATCIFTNIQAETKNPVLTVPGLLGTEMRKGEEKLWPDVPRMLASITDNFMDPLSFNSNLKPSDAVVFGSNIIRSEAAFDYSESLINEFAGQGYTENETLFTFPYDWRYGVSGRFEDGTSVADLLKQKIQDILQETGASKVDVVAHSQGGLLVKQYVMENPTNHNIGKAVFVGVPNTGAPKAVKGLLQGDNFGVSFGPFGFSDEEAKKISKNMPASYDLLPSQKYYDVKGSFVTTIYVPEATTEDPTAQGVLKELTYEETKSFLINDHSLNSAGLTGAVNLHVQTFDDFDMRTAGIDLYSLNGCKAATMSKITEITREGVFGNAIEYRNPKHALGDGTVPLESATNLPIDQQNKYYALVSDHGKMLSQNGTRQQIVNLISGSDLSVLNNLITQDISQCQLNGRAISVFSPIDISVTDQNGNKLGLADDESTINEIPNADFEVWGEHKFVFLPTDNGQTYNIEIQGTDSGTFTIKADNIQNSQTTSTEVFSNLAVTAELAGQINLTAGTTTLLLDTNGDGTTDQTVEPSSVIGPEQSDDLLPPVSTATITGEQGQLGFYRSDVSVEINATDDNSGVLVVNYNIDNGGWQKTAANTAEFAVSEEGQHAITFFSTDRAGNNEPEKTITFTIDKTPPEVSIEFDPSIKDLKFTGIDNGPVAVADNDNVITLTDQACNTTELTLRDRNRKIFMQAEIKDLKYNGVSADISRNSMRFLWIYDKKQNLKTLSQHVKSKNGYNILAIYNGRKTRLVGRDANGLIIKSFNGLKIIKVTTNKGDLGWSY